MEYSSWAVHGLDETFSTIRSQGDGLSRTNLDSEYAKMSVEIVRHLPMLGPQHASIVKAWLQKLNTSDNICLLHTSCERHSNDWRTSRNSLARGLVIALRDGILGAPFDSLPAEEALVPPAMHCSDRISTGWPATATLSRLSSRKSLGSSLPSISRVVSSKGGSPESTFSSQAPSSDSRALRALTEPLQKMPSRARSVAPDGDVLSGLTMHSAAESHAQYRMALSRHSSALSSPAVSSRSSPAAKSLSTHPSVCFDVERIASEYRELASRDAYRTLGAISSAGLGSASFNVSSLL